MKFVIRVKPNARQAKVEKLNDNEFLVRVRSPAKEGKANEETIELLSEYFDIPKTRIEIFKGHKSKIKLINID